MHVALAAVVPLMAAVPEQAGREQAVHRI